MNYKAILCEFIGTFALVFIGVGVIVGDHINNGTTGLVGIALAHGLTIAVMVSAIAAISGGHLNPAVTIGAFVGRKINPGKALGYIIAQCLGGIVAALLIKIVIPSKILETIAMGTPMLSSEISAITGVIVEAVLTFFLVFVVFGTGIDRRAPKVGGLFIGLTVTLDILMGGPLTGAAMNPARHLGPALLGGGFDNLWIYWVGPMTGGILAGLIYSLFLEEE